MSTHENDHTHHEVNHPHSPHVEEPKFVSKEMKFSFKKRKEKNEIGEEIKRPPVSLNVPIPTVNTILEEMVNKPKVASFVQELVENAIRFAVLEQVADDMKPVNRQSELNLDLVSLEAIASVEKSTRLGSSITTEQWEAWKLDYVKVNHEVSGRAIPKLVAAADLFIGKLKKVQEKKTLQFLHSELATWAAHTPNLDDFNEIFVYLDGRLEFLLKKEETDQYEFLSS